MVFTSSRLTIPWQKASVICGTVESGVTVAAVVAVAAAEAVLVPLLPVLVVVLPLDAQAASAISAAQRSAAQSEERGSFA
jgi:hypothetical protein